MLRSWVFQKLASACFSETRYLATRGMVASHKIEEEQKFAALYSSIVKGSQHST